MQWHLLKCNTWFFQPVVDEFKKPIHSHMFCGNNEHFLFKNYWRFRNESFMKSGHYRNSHFTPCIIKTYFVPTRLFAVVCAEERRLGGYTLAPHWLQNTTTMSIY